MGNRAYQPKPHKRVYQAVTPSLARASSRRSGQAEQAQPPNPVSQSRLPSLPPPNYPTTRDYLLPVFFHSLVHKRHLTPPRPTNIDRFRVLPTLIASLLLSSRPTSFSPRSILTRATSGKLLLNHATGHAERALGNRRMDLCVCVCVCIAVWTSLPTTFSHCLSLSVYLSVSLSVERACREGRAS